MNMNAKSAKVLLVEDNKINCEVALELMEPLFLDIKTASDGKKAVEMVKNESFDLIFMDYLMPVMDGLEATKEIRRLGYDESSLPIIALTAGNEDIEALLMSGMNDVIVKPLSLEKALYMLKIHISEKAELFDELVAADANAEEDKQDEPLPNIPGIDASLALKHCSSEAMAKKMWHDFAEIAEFKADELSSLLSDKRINDFRIEVHALKSSSNIIGAVGLSKKFENLENLAKTGSLEELKAKTPPVLLEYLKTKESIHTAIDDTPRELIEVPKNAMVTILNQLIDAANDIFLDGVDERLAELSRCIIPDNLIDDFKKLKYSVAEVNLPEATNISKRMISLIEANVLLGAVENE